MNAQLKYARYFNRYLCPCLPCRVTDNDGLTDSAIVNITVNNVNDPMAFNNLPSTVTLDAITTLKDTQVKGPAQ